MNSDHYLKEIFLSSLNALRKDSKNAYKRIKATINDKHLDILQPLISASFQPVGDIAQEIQKIYVLEKEARVYHAISKEVKVIRNNLQDFVSAPYKASKSFETLLWLVGSLEDNSFRDNLRGIIDTIYGNEVLADLDKFRHIDNLAFKKFTIKLNKDTVKKYIDKIKKLYVYQDQDDQEEEKKADSIFIDKIKNPEEQKIDLQKNINFQLIPEKSHSNQSLETKVIQGLKKEFCEIYDKIEPALKDIGDAFTDETFQPKITSLTSDVANFPFAKTVVWKRISEIYNKKDITLCSDQIGPNDIRQGRLGDCYFLSALSVLAEKRNLIKRLFYSKEERKISFR